MTTRSVAEHMRNTRGLPSLGLFRVGHVDARRLTEADLPALQSFFEANPGYFRTVNGMPPRPDEARSEFEDRPPTGMSFGQFHPIGFADAAGRLVAMASVISDFLARDVWHIGLFMVDGPLHGTGIASQLYAGLETWLKGEGAAWIRLGAVAGQTRAERFWERQGFTEVRQRTGMRLGRRVHTVRVFVKPVGDLDIAQYLGRVARDRPDSPLP